MLTINDKIIIKALWQEKHYGARKILREFPNRNWKLASVSRLLRKMRENNGNFERKEGSGRPRSVRTERNIEIVRRNIKSPVNLPGSSKSPRIIEKEYDIKRSSVRRIVKEDLNLKSYKRMYVHKISEESKRSRLDRCISLQRRFRRNENVNNIWFTDEKMFYLRPPKNSQNNRLYDNVAKKANISSDRLLVEQGHFVPGVMVSLGVSKLGKTSVIFIDAGAKINSRVYCHEVLEIMLPELEIFQDYYVFMQDGAPAHRSQYTINFLMQQCPEIIAPGEWPPNSPDLNPVDYAIWGTLEATVHKNRNLNTLDDLKNEIVRCWEMFDQNNINGAIDQWKRRLQKCIDLNGGHIEQFFK